MEQVDHDMTTNTGAAVYKQITTRNTQRGIAEKKKRPTPKPTNSEKKEIQQEKGSRLSLSSVVTWSDFYELRERFIYS